jgi:hypothetical protein
MTGGRAGFCLLPGHVPKMFQLCLQGRFPLCLNSLGRPARVPKKVTSAAGSVASSGWISRWPPTAGHTDWKAETGNAARRRPLPQGFDGGTSRVSSMQYCHFGRSTLSATFFGRPPRDPLHPRPSIIRSGAGSFQVFLLSQGVSDPPWISFPSTAAFPH